MHGKGEKSLTISAMFKRKSHQSILPYCRVILCISLGISDSSQITFDRNNIRFQKFPSYTPRLCSSYNWKTAVLSQLGPSFSYTIKSFFPQVSVIANLSIATAFAGDISKYGLSKKSLPFLTMKNLAGLFS